MPDTNHAPITKSQFKLGLDCIQKLRHARNGLPQTTQENDMLRLLAEGGAAIEALIRANEPGVFIGEFGEAALEPSRQEIAKAFSMADVDETTSLYEVTIAHGGFLARIDLLRISPGGIDLVEIKSKSVTADDGGVVPESEFVGVKGGVCAEWRPYIQDLAFQRELLRRWLIEHRAGWGTSRRSDLWGADGPKVSPRLLLVNKQGRATAGTVMTTENFKPTYEHGKRGIRASVTYRGSAPDAGLLVEVDMERIVGMIDGLAGSPVAEFANRGIRDCMEAMKQIVDTDRWPDPRASRCSSCKSCEFRVKPGLESGFDRCWGDPATRPVHHVLELTRISGKQLLPALDAAGPNASVLDVAPGNLSDSQRRQYESLLRGHPTVDASFAADPLAALSSGCTDPIYFFDCETAMCPVPARVGGRPFELIPFQFEAHVLPSASAGLQDRVRLPGFLELVDPDPRRGFIDALMAQVGERGPIFHWSPYERTVLSSIKRGIQESPQAGDEFRIAFIESLAGADGEGGGRLVDLLTHAKASFYHPDQCGSYSIKKVVPIAWAIPDIRRHFVAGHGAAVDPDSYSGESDPYDGLPAPPKSILEAVGGDAVAKEIMQADDGEQGAVRNGGMAMLAYHYVRMFPGHADNPEIVAQFRQYCRLDSAAMVMAYALMRDHVAAWLKVAS